MTVLCHFSLFKFKDFIYRIRYDVRHCNINSVEFFDSIRLLFSILFLFGHTAYSQPKIASTKDITVLSQNQNEIIFSFIPQWEKNGQATIIQSGGVTFQEYQFLNGVTLGEPGDPKSPSRIVPLLLPSMANPTVEILEIKSVSLQNTTLVPIPFENFKSGSISYNQGNKYNLESFVSPVQVGKVEIVRGYPSISVIISPLRFSPKRKTLEKIERITLKIRYATVDSPPTNAFFNRSSQQVKGEHNFFSQFLNYGVINRFSIPKLQNTFRESVLKTGRFVRLELREEGIYRLDRAYLESIGISTSGLNPRKLKIYFNGAEELDLKVNTSRIQDLREIPILVTGESDGRFDDGDAILFYATGASGFVFRNNQLSHYLNRQSNSAFAFLSTEGEDGKRILSLPSETGNPISSPESFQTLSFVENDRVNFANTSLNFYDRALSSTLSRQTYTISAEGIDRNRPITYRVRAVAQSRQTELFTLTENGRQIRQVSVFQPSGFYQESTLLNLNATVDATRITGETSRLDLDFSASNSASTFYPDWAELQYWRGIEARNGFLKFNSLTGQTASGIVEYRVRNASQSGTIWDITNLSEITALTGTTFNSGVLSFRATSLLNSYREYVYFGDGISFKRPVSASAVANQNLKGLSLLSQSAYPNYIIVYGKDFEAAAERLRDYRSNRTLWGAEALNGITVSVESIFNEFSGGKQDFTAIRDFVKFLYDNAPSETAKPKHVLLFGDGDWDPRNILGAGYSKVPTHQTEENLFSYTNQIQTTDDFFVAVDGEDIRPDLAIGRITVQTASNAALAVDKIIEYETASDQGDWRNRAIFVADDGPNGNEGNDGNRFCFDSEFTISQMLTTAPYMNPVKVYSGFYRFERSTGGLRRPDAFNEIIRQINLGAVATNYIGHGNPTVWTAERIFEPSFSLPLISNRKRMTLAVTATCDFGRADDPNSQSGGEAMFLLQDGGAIALITNSRSILISSGSAYPPILFRSIFERDSNLQYFTLGEILFRFKSSLYASGFLNDIEKFFLLGDPALRLVGGGITASIDSINSTSPTPIGVINLPALGRATISGSIRNIDSTISTGFNGKASIVVFDASRQLGTDNNAAGSFDSFFEVQNAAIYRGTVNIQNGKFRVNFVIPKNISYDSLRTGRISLTAWQESANSQSNLLNQNAQGFFNQIRLFGTNSNATADTEGPFIEVSFDEPGFVSGGLVSQNPVFLATVSDPNGINLTQRVGQEISLVLNNDERNPVILNEFFQSAPESFTDGTVRYPLKNLVDGKYELKFKVWDTFNNSSERILNFTVQNSSEPSLFAVYNYPNPFRSTTAFVFTHNAPVSSSLTATIRIYSVSGRLLKAIDSPFVSGGSQVKIEWDGRDTDGNELANGVYLYKVTLHANDGAFHAEKLEKLLILR
ncbi:MAG: type IX secretion system sortase PorU [Chloroherpetonaceae bacterium]|nr:type IX secretion system sortase PorU [Chloroherpetonaceae bacterium]